MPTFDHRKHDIFMWDDSYAHEPPDLYETRLGEAREQLGYNNEHFPAAQYPKMLCLGAGTGAEIQAANEMGYEAIGIGLLYLEGREIAEAHGVKFYQMDMHDLRFPNGSFDVIYSHESFEHCLNPWLVAVELWVSLRYGGRLFIRTPGPNGGPAKGHWTILTRPGLEAIFTATGFKIIVSKGSNLDYFYVFEKTKDSKIMDIIIKRLKIGEEYKQPRYIINEEEKEKAINALNEYGKLNLKIVWMPPLAYLKMAGWPPEEHGGPKYQVDVWYFGDWSPDSIIEALKKGDPLPPATFLMGVREGHFHQDGKKRAYWSWKLGVKEIPVLINEEAEKTAAKYKEREEYGNEHEK